MKLKDLFFPSKFTCFSCGKEIPEGEVICDECFTALKVIVGDKICVKCGAKIKADEIVCDKCKGKTYQFDRAYCVFQYQDPVKNLILRFKNGEKILADRLADYLFYKYKTIEESVDLITFAPMTISDERKRGYNQSRELAEKLSKKVGKEVFYGVCKERPTKPQKKLNYINRQKNVKGAFGVTGRLDGKTLLIVDDVFTTGATASEIAKELKRKGAEKVLFLDLARD